MERLYDFEEECAEGLTQTREDESLKKTDVRVKNVLEMMEEVRSKMDDLERCEATTQESNQSVEYRLQRMEEIAQQTSSQLAVIHRFMTSQNGNESHVDDSSNVSGVSSDNENETANLSATKHDSALEETNASSNIKKTSIVKMPRI